MGATRPIPREVTTADVNAAVGLTVHEGMGKYAAPQAHPGFLTTNPDLAGVQVKGQLGGGYFAPPSKTAKFK